MKRLVCAFLGVFLAIGLLAGCGGNGGPNASGSSQTNSENGNTVGNLTRKEPLTLTYASWEEDELEEFLAQKFEQKYDWITVDRIDIAQDGYEQGLFNLASTGDLPDAFWTFYVADAASNGWAKDITDIYDDDVFTAKIPDDMKAAGVYNGVRYGVVVQQFPWVIFLNETLMEQANIPMPSYDWTYQDMMDIVSQISAPNQNIYGISDSFYALDAYLPMLFSVMNTDKLTTWGFNTADGSFDLTEWAGGVAAAKNLASKKLSASLTPEQKEKAYGVADIWMPETGKLAIQLDWFWTCKYIKSEVFTDKGMEWRIYPQPTGSSGRRVTTVDMGAVAETTEYPEEAYELLKFMTFGSDGWMARKEYYEFNHKIPTSLPVANDEEVWSMIKTLTPGEDWAAVYDSMPAGVPDVGKWLPGYGAFWSWTFEQDVWGKLYRGETKPEDVAKSLETKLKTLYDEYMVKIEARKK